MAVETRRVTSFRPKKSPPCVDIFSGSDAGEKLSPKNNSKLKIPIYREVLFGVSGYEEAVVFNQLLYHTKPSGVYSNGLNVYELSRVCAWDKSIQALRRRLRGLEERGLISKTGSNLYGVVRYKPVPEAWVADSTLVTLLEGCDLSVGDYWTAAILNYFRQRVLDGAGSVKVSMRELVDMLHLDRGRSAVKVRLDELEKAGILKGKLHGRIYSYELNAAYLLNNMSPEATHELGKRLNVLFSLHLNRLKIYSKTDNELTFQRMLLDGYDYGDMLRIIAFLGVEKGIWRERVRSAAHIRKWYEELYDAVYRGISKRKASRYLYKLSNGYFESIEEKPSVTAARPLEVPDKAPDGLIWEEVIKWGEKYRGDINYLCQRYAVNTILDKEDVYQSMLCMAFQYVKKGKTLGSMNKSYMGKYVQGFLLARRAESGSDVSCADLEGYISTADYETEKQSLPDYSGREIPAKLLHIPPAELNVVLDYFGREGRRYNQRELALKYGKSLGYINGIIRKRVPEICTLYNLPPPAKFLSGKKQS